MNKGAIELEMHLRTLRDRMELEVGDDLRERCKCIYLADVAIDNVHSSNSAEIADDLGLPRTLPKRDWCRGCNDPWCKKP